MGWNARFGCSFWLLCLDTRLGLHWLLGLGWLYSDRKQPHSLFSPNKIALALKWFSYYWRLAFLWIWGALKTRLYLFISFRTLYPPTPLGGPIEKKHSNRTRTHRTIWLWLLSILSWCSWTYPMERETGLFLLLFPECALQQHTEWLVELQVALICWTIVSLQLRVSK